MSNRWMPASNRRYCDGAGNGDGPGVEAPSPPDLNQRGSARQKRRPHAHFGEGEPRTQEACLMVSQPSSTTRDLPEPMTPPECDLRGAEYMPLFGQRLAGSTFYSLALSNPRAGLAALKLWWEAWQQCPAGSLPVDDRTLCRMADFGTDLRGWGRAKTIALHGFILCSDGRLYHPLICETALWVHQKRVKDRKRQANYRSGKGNDVTRDTTGDTMETRRGGDEDVFLKVSKGKEREESPRTPPLGGPRRRHRDELWKMDEVSVLMGQGMTLAEANAEVDRVTSTRH